MIKGGDSSAYQLQYLASSCLINSLVAARRGEAGGDRGMAFSTICSLVIHMIKARSVPGG